MRLLRLLFICAWSSAINSVSLYRNGGWDHFIFVQQYPAGICLSQQESSKCSYPANATSWTIHGLWPTLGDTKGPNYCNKSAAFNLSEIKDLIPKLMVEWPNLITGKDFDSFWEHEWCKHGTCSGIPDEHTFFKTVLGLFDDIQFVSILQENEILPDDDQDYHASDILNAFKKELGVFPYSISCEGVEGTFLLGQIGICLDKNTLKPSDCPSGTEKSTCGDGNIRYPTSKYSHH